MFQPGQRIQYIGRPTEKKKTMSVYTIKEVRRDGSFTLKETGGIHISFNPQEPIQTKPPYTYHTNFINWYTEEEIKAMRDNMIQDMITTADANFAKQLKRDTRKRRLLR